MDYDYMPLPTPFLRFAVHPREKKNENAVVFSQELRDRKVKIVTLLILESLFKPAFEKECF